MHVCTSGCMWCSWCTHAVYDSFLAVPIRAHVM
jgi:hypothetical protein